MPYLTEMLLIGLAGPLGFFIGRLIRFRVSKSIQAGRARIHLISKTQADLAQAAEAAVGDIRQSVEGLVSVVSGTQKRLISLERHYDCLENNVHMASRRQGFTEAISLAAAGMPEDDLVSRCGLSRAEANLLARVHAGRSNH